MPGADSFSSGQRVKVDTDISRFGEYNASTLFPEECEISILAHYNLMPHATPDIEKSATKRRLAFI